MSHDVLLDHPKEPIADARVSCCENDGWHVMPKRFAFLCVIFLFLSTSAFAQATNPAATTAERTFWDHNGSIVYLVANGSVREIYYQKPRPGMLEAGAHPDSLLFRGQINDGQFSGTAYLFNPHCGQVPFAVKGPILDNGERVVLTGQAPRLGRNCQAYGEYTSTLEFKLLKTTEVAQPEQTPATAPTPNIETSKPELPSRDAGEPKLPITQSAQPTTHTPSSELPKPEVPSSAVGKPNEPAQIAPTAQTPSIEEQKPEPHEVSEPKQSTSAPIAAQSFIDKDLLAPLIIAMNVALPLLSILFLVVMLK
jgi:hypothetical protein